MDSSIFNLPMTASPVGDSPSQSSQSSQRDDVSQSSSLYEPLGNYQSSWSHSQPSFDPFSAAPAPCSHDFFPTPIQSTFPFESLPGQTPWTQSPAPGGTSATPIYPSFDALSSPPTGIPASFDMTSGLTPMFGAFSTITPTNESFSPASLPTTSRPGSVRGYSAGSLPTLGNRRRASTIMSLSSASPVTPAHSYYPYPSPHIFTQPSPHQHLGQVQIQGQGQHVGSQQPENPRIGRLFRQPSAPAFGETKRIFHPSPGPAQGGDGLHYYSGASSGASSISMGMGMGFGIGGAMGIGMEPKPPRFKPTKEQLDILIKSYEEDKNPDGPTREALARQLGPEVRPKTLQIWFQNRRSKSRAKERNAANVTPTKLSTTSPNARQVSADERIGLSLTSPSSAGTEGGAGSMQYQAERDALRRLTRDNSTNLTILPITVLSISKWTRFLTPGTGHTHPDLGAAVSFSLPTPTLHLYILHGSLFRLDIPLSPSTIQGLQATSNPGVSLESVAVRFQMIEGGEEFWGWQDGMGWVRVGDFTGGQAGEGGKVELTGSKEVLLPAFSRVQQIVNPTAYPTPISSADLLSRHHTHPPTDPSPSPWRFPNSASPSSTPTPELAGPPSAELQPRKSLGIFTGMSHQRQRSFSQPQFPTTSFLAELAAPPLPLPLSQDSSTSGLQTVLGTQHQGMESTSSVESGDVPETDLSGLEWLSTGGETSRSSYEAEEVEGTDFVKQERLEGRSP
ncbi:hypothetical protein L198_07932 [Cryptococcus wingfieldii CBS 7118]|uniref:Homeobox domain-containing protein n=1 Tax=Cryptococcus wingfieldii CBS 7118 TaxID=1295528 RepID=A0A1E3HRQ5_9TREE|nr:hypothetical protein L198_07932 [Cryptococcus wingfieldii CBS 7118]ODN79053.1 hypothetical protein L198_07932 [Cryptococcus wingfieldii CBS 7118]